MSEMAEWLRQVIEDDMAAATLMAVYLPPPWDLYDWGWMAHVVADGPYFRDVTRDVPCPGSVIAHITRHDPRDTITRCEADLALLNDLLAEKHVVCDDQYYTCAAATRERDGRDPDENRIGGRCDCGRDDRVERRLRLLASGRRHSDGYKQDWKP